jgi:hypothetical protein
MTDLTPITGGQAIAVPDTQRNARTALGLWLASYRSENTRHAYRREIEAFAAFHRPGGCDRGHCRLPRTRRRPGPCDRRCVADREACQGLVAGSHQPQQAALNLTLFPDGSLELSKYAQHVEEGAAATDPAAS